MSSGSVRRIVLSTSVPASTSSDPDQFCELLGALATVSDDATIVMPVNARRVILDSAESTLPDSIQSVETFGYLDFPALSSRFVWLVMRAARVPISVMLV